MKNILTTVFILLAVGVLGQVPKTEAANLSFISLEFHGGMLFPTPFNDVFTANLGYQFSGFGVFNKGESFNALVGIGYQATSYHSVELLSTRGSLSDVNVAINQIQIPVGARLFHKQFFIQSTINAVFYVDSKVTAMADEWYMYQNHHPENAYDQNITGTSIGFSLGCGMRLPINESAILVYPQYNLNQGTTIKSERLSFHTTALNVAWQF